ncbi:MAG: hypothetical protein L3K10_02645 [Thermoplasmata archaeon]|nr:hypothetical protein [Thermoplasmata archaeon]
MVLPSLSIGATVGVILSAGFVYFEVGRYATPQVPTTLFDERREIFAYTAGLFVGIPFAVIYVLYILAMGNGALPGALVFLALLVGGAELAQWVLLRSAYWGRTASGPFYALGFRAAIGGIIALAVVAQVLGVPSLRWDSILLALVQSVAVVALEVTGALLSLPPGGAEGRTGGGPLAAGVFAAFGFFLIGIGTVAGEAGSFGGAAFAALGAFFVYRRLRLRLARIPPPTARLRSEPVDEPAAYGRTKGVR